MTKKRKGKWGKTVVHPGGLDSPCHTWCLFEIDRIVCHFLTLTLTLLIFLMKHSLHFATKLNSRDIDEKCNNYCFGYPSMIWGQGWWGVWGRSNLPEKKLSSPFWIKVWTSRIKNSWIRPLQKKWRQEETKQKVLVKVETAVSLLNTKTILKYFAFCTCLNFGSW